MKTRAYSLIAIFGFVGLAVSAQNQQSYIGEIIDGPCANMASHELMMKSHPNMKTASDCALGCVKAGSQYILYDSSTKNSYQLDGQKKLARFAGQKVIITGTLEADKTVRVVSIKTAPERPAYAKPFP